MAEDSEIQIGSLNRKIIREARESYKLIELKTDINTATIFLSLALFAAIIFFLIMLLKKQFPLQYTQPRDSEV